METYQTILTRILLICDISAGPNVVRSNALHSLLAKKSDMTLFQTFGTQTSIC